MYYKRTCGEIDIKIKVDSRTSFQQPNYKDCGVYLMANAEGILKQINEKGSFTEKEDCKFLIDENTIKKKRVEITKLIMSKASVSM